MAVHERIHKGGEEMSMNKGEVYLGDAVYASFDGYQIKLRTGDGNNQVIYLEPSVYTALQLFARRTFEEVNSAISGGRE